MLKPRAKAVLADWLENGENRTDAVVSDKTLWALLAIDCRAAVVAAIEEVRNA